MTEGRVRILVVDDDARNARLLRMMLGVHGYDAVIVDDGTRALEAVEAGIGDLVLLDVMMPGLDGFEVCRRIRAREIELYGHAPVLPVVMVTALGAGEHRARGLDAGADDFLTKPVNDIELLARVRSLLRIKTLHDALEARNRLLFDALQRSVSAPVAAQIIEDPARYLRPGGERRRISVLFADLRGYSTVAEEVLPAEAMTVLNTYLGRLIDVVYRHGGTVNQLLGDGIMSLFGAPLAHGDDTWRAVQAALDMRDEIVALEPPGLPDIRLAMGIGITTGDAVVGHIGSEKRIDYTAVGDVVNLASRFQDHAGPGQILISVPTYEAVKDRVVVADAGTQSVKGRIGWVQAYSVLGRAGMA